MWHCPKKREKMGLEGENGKHQTSRGLQKVVEKRQGKNRLARFKQEVRKKAEVGSLSKRRGRWHVSPKKCIFLN